MLLGLARLDLLFSLRPGKLEPGLLLRKFGIRLLDLEQALDNLWLGHLQITISRPVSITLRINTQRMGLY